MSQSETTLHWTKQLKQENEELKDLIKRLQAPEFSTMSAHNAFEPYTVVYQCPGCWLQVEQQTVAYSQMFCAKCKLKMSVQVTKQRVE